jgi:hypothetical protein
MRKKRHRFDLPDFFRTDKYYDFLKNISEEEFKKVMQGDEVSSIDLITRKFQASLKDQKSKYQEILKKYEALDTDYNNLLYIGSHVGESKEIKPIEKKKKHEATAKVIWSDWHIDEVVDRSKVNWLNSYNPEIARKRSELCVVNTIKLLDKERNDVNIDNLVLHLGGDFIGGWIHPELEQTNSMSPVEASIYAVELLSNCLDYLINHGNLKRIVAITNVGNHGRTTKKMQIGNQTETNLETFIYSSLKRKFGSQIEFIDSDSTLVYYKIYDLVGRYYHGHQVGFGGGIGGLTIPLNKKQGKWDQAIKADFNSMGHFHTLCYPNSNTTLNGSLKGFDTFAQEIGAKFEKPVQAFELIDSKYGFTIKSPIICE